MLQLQFAAFWIAAEQWNVKFFANFGLWSDFFHRRVSPDFFYEVPSWYKSSNGDKFPWKLASTDDGFNFCPLYCSIAGNCTYNENNMFQPLNLYRGIIHSPYELPYRTGNHRFQGRYDVLSWHIVSEIRRIDKDLEAWKPKQRNCFMDGEKKLNFFKIYTKASCEHECLSRASLKTCGCIPFYMIRKSQII